jgi:alkaline phosphatase D
LCRFQHRNGAGFAKLKPGKKYVVRVGTLTIDDPFPNDESVSDETLARRLPRPNEADWFADLLKLKAETSEARFKTFPEKTDDLSVILGSCRYPGILWKVKEADQIFGPLWLEAQGKGPPIAGDPAARGPASFVLMVGDQIYADMLNRGIRARTGPTPSRSFRSAISLPSARAICEPYFGRYPTTDPRRS